MTNTKGLGQHQRRMMRFLKLYGSGNTQSIAMDGITPRVAASLERRSLLTIDRTFSQWTIKA